MKITLYHGTTLRNAKKILQEGLKPRGDSPSNWETGIGKSRDNLVYLTNCYACYFASCSCKADDDVPVVLKLEIDIEKLQLYPDEEFIFRGSGLKNVSEDEAIKVYENIDPTNIGEFRNAKTDKAITWADSLEYMGTVCAKEIPKEMIVGVCEGKGADFIMNCDPCISPLNYKICGERYKKYLENLDFKNKL